MTTEWGVWYARTDEFWRGPWTESEARDWVRETEDDGFRPDAFFVVKREVGEWEAAS